MSFGGIQTTDPASSFDYPAYYRFAWGAALNDVEPTSSPTWSAYQASQSMILTEEIEKASSTFGGNPYDGVAMADPTSQLSGVQTRQNYFVAFIDDLDETNLTAIMAAAVARYDANLSTVSIEDTVSAAEDASLASHLDSVGRAHASLWAARAMMGTQAFMTVAALEHDRQLRHNEQAFKLRLFGDRERTEGILRLTESLLRQRAVQAEAARAATGIQFDIAKLDVAMHQDKLEHDTEMEVRAQTWDLDLFAYQWQGLAALGGASTIPRAQTKRERLAASIFSSASMATQVGVASGSIELAAVTMAVALAGQVYGMG